jgi:hypothetical protein
VTDRLSLYNAALTTHLGEPPLVALTDDVPARYLLDGVWDRNGVRRCLQQGQWNFAARSAALEPDESITPTAGYRHAFPKPDDFIRTLGVHSDEYFTIPLLAYIDETAYWWSDVDTLYVRFVSDDDEYGLNFDKWPHNFTSFVEGWFALQICTPTTYADRKDGLAVEVKRLKLDAVNTDAMEQGSKQNPRGSWSSSRGASGGIERGSRGRLIG